MVNKFANLPYDRLSDWIYAFVVVNFDIDFGQVIEKNVINYSSFPDSHSDYLGDTLFHYRMRCPTFDQLTKCKLTLSRTLPPFLKPTPGYCFCYVLFRQVRDTALRRNYFQKSVVILSPYPFDALFSKLLNIIAPDYFLKGVKALEEASSQIDKWPQPTPGESMVLELMGRNFPLSIPIDYAMQHHISSGKDSSSEIDPNLYSINFATSLMPVISHLQRIWELVIIGQSILVVGHCPRQCSHTVQSLVSCISPLFFAGEYRPFFTIQDPDYKEFTSIKTPNSAIILGVTNPFFCKVIGHWPNIIRLNCNIQGQAKKKKNSILKSLVIDDSKPGLYSNYKPFLKRSRYFKQLKH
ncbi:Protein dennd6a, partial [Cichlidogyrus casuarinus]